jgi:hypothetical protein
MLQSSGSFGTLDSYTGGSQQILPVAAIFAESTRSTADLEAADEDAGKTYIPTLRVAPE